MFYDKQLDKKYKYTNIYVFKSVFMQDQEQISYFEAFIYTFCHYIKPYCFNIN